MAKSFINNGAFYYIKTEDNKSWKGPYSLNSILELNLSDNTLVWEEGADTPYFLKDMDEVTVTLFPQSNFNNPVQIINEISSTDNSKVEIEPIKTEFGSFWKRLFAHLIDTSILFFFYSFGWVVFSFPYPEDGKSVFWDNLLIFSNPILIVFSCIFFASFESSKFQSSPGKIILGLKVTNENFNRINFINASGRYFGKILSGLIFGIGFLIIFITINKQGFHDQMAKTLVMKESNRNEKAINFSWVIIVITFMLFIISFSITRSFG